MVEPLVQSAFAGSGPNAKETAGVKAEDEEAAVSEESPDEEADEVTCSSELALRKLLIKELVDRVSAESPRELEKRGSTD